MHLFRYAHATLCSFFITGTDTGVGKTYITARLCNMFRQAGLDVGVMKPVSTGGRDDALYLLKHTGLKDPLDWVNPIYFKPPIAPTIAAKLAGRSIKINKIFSAYKKLKTIHKDGILIEGVGGALVPLNKNYLVADLIKELRIPAIIIIRPTLGTANHTLLTIEALKTRKIPISGFIVNYGLPGNKSRRRLEKLTACQSPLMIEQISGVGEINIEFIRERLTHIKCAGL
ncbi:MAG: dethiobiotin synthase [Planctomycetes bacterium]|nr:dethiobiotin synthase [Planctomycetota bacterium]